MNKKFILLIALAFLLMPFVVAEVGDAGNPILVKQNTNYNLTRSCINNGTWCLGSAVCNITVTAQNRGTNVHLVMENYIKDKKIEKGFEDYI